HRRLRVSGRGLHLGGRTRNREDAARQRRQQCAPPRDAWAGRSRDGRLGPRCRRGADPMSDGLRRRAVLALPYAGVLLFFLAPFFIVLKISLAESAIGIPPYMPLFSTDASGWHLQLSLGSYKFLISDSLYLRAYLDALKFAAVSTFFCLLLGYPLAYGIVR